MILELISIRIPNIVAAVEFQNARIKLFFEKIVAYDTNKFFELI